MYALMGLWQVCGQHNQPIFLAFMCPCFGSSGLRKGAVAEGPSTSLEAWETSGKKLQGFMSSAHLSVSLSKSRKRILTQPH